jgi:hypothetical protein
MESAPFSYNGSMLHALLRIRSLAAVLVLAFLAGCSPVSAERAQLHQELGTWLKTRALPDDTVAVSEEDAGWFDDWPVVPLPATDDAFVLLDVLRAETPDYVIATESVVWDGVRAQAWFRSHYHRAHVVSDAYDTHSPLVLYFFRPSPFDTGNTTPLTTRFVSDDVGTVELQDYRVSDSRVLPEVPLYLTLRWLTTTGVEEPLRLQLELVDVESGRVWVRTRRSAPGGITTDLWLDNYLMRDQYVLVPPSDLPIGSYALRLTLQRPNGTRLRVGTGGELALTLAMLEQPSVVSEVQPQDISTVQATFGESIELVGFTAPAWGVPGDTVRVVLYWHARDPVAEDYKVFVHLLTPEGRILAQDDSQPANWTYPTTDWKAGEYIRDAHVLTIDPETPWGEWTLTVGMYDPTKEVRLPILQEGEQQSQDVVVLRKLRVR